MLEPLRSTNSAMKRWDDLLTRACHRALGQSSEREIHAFVFELHSVADLFACVLQPGNQGTLRVLIGHPQTALSMLWSGGRDIQSDNLTITDLFETSSAFTATEALATPARPSLVVNATGDLGRRVAMVLDARRCRDGQLVSATALSREILDQLDTALEGYLAELRLDLARRVCESMLPALIASDKGVVFQAIERTLRHDLGFGRLLIGVHQETAATHRIEHAFGFDTAQQLISLPAGPGADPGHPIQDLILRGEVRLFEPQSEGQEVILPFTEGGSADGSAFLPLQLAGQTLGFVYADRFHSRGVALLRDPLEALQRLATAAMAAVRQKHEAEELAHRDPLTGLHNRRFLDRVIGLEAGQMKRYSRPLSLMMVDLCDFKRINDQHGHVFGDRILRETAQLLRNNVREPDIVVRFGGDEFVILLPNTGAPQALIARNRIERAVLERNQSVGDPSMRIELSIGMKTADASNIHRLIDDADQLMYSQKTERTKRRIIEVLLGLPGHATDIVDNVITSLLTSLKKREPFYGGHSQRVAFLCLVMARDLHLPAREIRSILLAALLHDVGKVSLPGEILRRPGPLDPAEREAIQAHPTIGEEFFRGLQYMEGARPIIRHHHERWDGARDAHYPAYPDGIRGEDIPIGARILKLADSMDAMLSERPYKPAQSPDQVREELRRERGHSFDPSLVDLMIQFTAWDKLTSVEELHQLYQAVMNDSNSGTQVLIG